MPLVKQNPFSWPELRQLFPTVQWGFWQPASCVPRHSTVVLVPYRNRDLHLRLLLQNLHPVLQRQLLSYRIVVVQQAAGERFNRGALFNAGFLESRRRFPTASCFVLHDVDMVPENDHIMYRCVENTMRLMSMALSKWNYKRPNLAMAFGGVGSLSAGDFLKVNGFSNLYYGWGGEDDDLRARVESRKVKIDWLPLQLARYFVFSHGRDKGNEVNEIRWNLLKNGLRRQAADGVNSINYTLVADTNYGVAHFITVQLQDMRSAVAKFGFKPLV